jgi:hypothetical protein
MDALIGRIAAETNQTTDMVLKDFRYISLRQDDCLGFQDQRGSVADAGQ